MITRFTLLIVHLVVTFGYGQTISDTQVKALNNYTALANHLTDEVSGLGKSLEDFYSRIPEYRKSKRPIQQYQCKMDARPYYYEEADKSATGLGQQGVLLRTKVEALKNVYQEVDKTCKAIEIYFRLKDYERDNLQKFEEFVQVIQKQLKDFKVKAEAYHQESDQVYNKLQIYDKVNPYQRAERSMHMQLYHEREMLDAWSFNVNEAVHSGWPYEKMQQHIIDNQKRIDELKKVLPDLKYPASSMVKSFIESLESLQDTKRRGVDGYTFEKQRNDGYSNQLYYNLINYYNNAAVSFFNSFIKMAGQNGLKGLVHPKYVPTFEIKTEVQDVNLEVTPFVDQAYLPLKIQPVATPISTPTFKALTNYIEFINDGVRQINHMMNPLRNLNSSASRGKARMKTGNKVIIDYYYKSFEMPVTLYQQTVDQSKSIPPAYQKSLIHQLETLNSILSEINQWNNILLTDATQKTLTKDSLDHVYKIFERYKILAEAFDERKERLYDDVRNIFETYKITDSKNSWVVSGTRLLELIDEDRKELFVAKKFLTGDVALKNSSEKINQLARDLITNEYDNLKGIQKLGRYNGNCPYTPYEDLASHSNSFIDAILKVKPGDRDSYYRHPYNKFVHTYSETLLQYYNKFTELAKVPLLKGVEQVQLFEIIEPEEPKESITNNQSVAVVQPQQNPNTKNDLKNEREKQIEGRVIHDTVRITDVIRIETVRQDTVYVSRVDTVYVGIPGENLLSMEGYATNNMVLLLDVSGSMNSPDKLPLLKKSVLLLLKMMRPEDEVSIVTYSGKAKVVLQPTSFTEEDKIKKVIERLKSEGKTDGNAGLKLAYEVADKNYIRGGNNRIILATDGEFPISNDVYKLVEKFSSEDILISVFNFGNTTNSSKNLQKLASTGRGNYEYISQANVDQKLVQEAKAKKKK